MSSSRILKEKLGAIRKVFDTSEILNIDTSPKRIARYYKINKFAYWLFVSRQGFVHMGLSSEQKLKAEDFKEHPRQISAYIEKVKAKKVLELVCGEGGNLRVLSKRHPDIDFME